ncbi:hypothetical protein KKH30_01390 [Candidatus Micrarchaeota archaeon]|nr:hypothetical protein [Candidatus Micrarchaeota archaeon]
MAEADIRMLLGQLGLTEYEAKVMEALFSLREAEAPEVSRKAQVPKTRVYDVLERLAKRGLIIGIYGRPKKYRAVEAGEVFNTLIQDKRTMLSELEKIADKMKDSFGPDIGNGPGERVMKVKDKSDFMRILGQEIDGAKTSVFAMANLGKEHGILRENIKAAAGKNVEFRMVSKIAQESKKLAKEFGDAGVTFKECEHGMHAYVIDGKKVVLALSDFAQDKPEYHFTIWPDNVPLAEALGNYFEQCWKKGK